MIHNLPEVVTVKEASQVLRVSTDTVRRMVDTGALPGFRTGIGKVRPHIRILRRDLEDYIASQERVAVRDSIAPPRTIHSITRGHQILSRYGTK